MLTILHGDNIVASRLVLNQHLNRAKQAKIKDIIRLDGKEIKLEDLIQALESSSFFGTNKLVIVENLFSRPRSQEKSAILNYLSTSISSIETNLVIWEKKEIKPSSFKKFPKAKIQLFKTPAIIFKFLDSLKPKNTKVMLSLLSQCLQSDSAEIVFYMLARQIRLLFLALEPKSLKLAPWQVNELKAQAQQLGPPKLKTLHQKLLAIDERIKTGQSFLGLAGELDLLLLSL
jgi:DNA polymerase III delta subunit